MLLTKHLSTFLNANRTSHLHTLLLVTPTGKLLSSASPLPSSTLRNQATLACSLWELYSPLVEDGTVDAALPTKRNHEADAEADQKELRSILIQLDHGIMTIRALKSSLFLVSIGSPASSSTSAHRQQQLSQGLEHLTLDQSSRSDSDNAEDRGNLHVTRTENWNGTISSTASDAGSANTGVGVNSIKLLRRQTEELGKFLDEELEGFSLSTAL